MKMLPHSKALVWFPIRISIRNYGPMLYRFWDRKSQFLVLWIRYAGPRRNIAITSDVEQVVKVIWQKAPHGGPIPRLGVTPGGRKLYHWITGVGFPISVP